MRNFFRGRAGSFKPAFEGVLHVFGTQPNSWVHSFISIAVIAAGIGAGLDFIAWALIVLAMALVWVSEFANTAMEALVDVASPDHHPSAKVAKDVSAAAVVIAALAAVIIGLLVLGPPLWMRISAILTLH